MNAFSPDQVPEPNFDALYREVILEHYRDPHGKQALDHASAHAEGMNPLCGDEVDVSVLVEDGRCTAVQVAGHGCAISVASGSILWDLVVGQPIDAVRRVIAAVRGVMHGGEMPADVDLGDFDALEGVKQFPVRIKCALLPWTTLEEALATAARNDGAEGDTR